MKRLEAEAEETLPKTPTIADVKSQDKDVATLNRLLRGEISAVDTYGQCIEKLGDPDTVRLLRDLRLSHMQRRDKIWNRIKLLGGKPDSHSGAWGALAGVAEGGAALIGDKPALEMLEQGEKHGTRMYDQLDDVSSATRTFIFNELLPGQERTATELRTIVQTFE